MPSPTTAEQDRLLGLIKAARDDAERLGPPAQSVVRLLQEADKTARSLFARGQGAAEGVPVEHLTTANDL